MIDEHCLQCKAPSSSLVFTAWHGLTPMYIFNLSPYTTAFFSRWRDPKLTLSLKQAVLPWPGPMMLFPLSRPRSTGLPQAVVLETLRLASSPTQCLFCYVWFAHHSVECLLHAGHEYWQHSPCPVKKRGMSMCHSRSLCWACSSDRGGWSHAGKIGLRVG